MCNQILTAYYLLYSSCYILPAVLIGTAFYKALLNLKEPCAQSKAPGVQSKEPGVQSKEPCVQSKEPGVQSKEPCAQSKEPCAQSKEPFSTSCILLATLYQLF